MRWLLGVMGGLVASFSLARPIPMGDPDSTTVHVVDRATLLFRGRAIHRRFIFDIYELSLYLADVALSDSQIVLSPTTKYVRLRFLRDLKAPQIRDAFLDTFNENCLLDCESLRPQLALFLKAIPDASEGGVIEFVFRADATLISTPGGGSVSIVGDKFGQLLLRSWVGDNPPSGRFKRELLKRE
ncbi:MAG: chalcone isomerase family protein [Bdellovibrionales bacterium]|nr:chalcone isomerase family protein [Bdellovibrionales bacterium]